jgi:hypothetical protein
MRAGCRRIGAREQARRRTAFHRNSNFRAAGDGATPAASVLKDTLDALSLPALRRLRRPRPDHGLDGHGGGSARRGDGRRPGARRRLHLQRHDQPEPAGRSAGFAGRPLGRLFADRDRRGRQPRAGACSIMDLQTDGEGRRLAISPKAAPTPPAGVRTASCISSLPLGLKPGLEAPTPTGRAPVQVTNLPLDVNAYRLSPDASKRRRVAGRLRRVRRPACSVDPRQGRGRRIPRPARSMTGCSCDTGTPGTTARRTTCSWSPPPAAVIAVWVTRGFDGDNPSKPFGDESEFTFTPDGQAIVFSARQAGKSEPWSTNFDLYQTRA